MLSANYIAKRLGEHFPVLYKGHGGLVAHECILDLRDLTKRTGVTVDDVAKRLVDYGFHSPTMSFPVAGTLMVEPTESEDLAEIDRFFEAMIAIRAEIDRVAAGEWTPETSPLRGAPHTSRAAHRRRGTAPTRARSRCSRPATTRTSTGRRSARIDQAYGDRNLVCSCPSPGGVRVGPRRMTAASATSPRAGSTCCWRASRPTAGCPRWSAAWCATASWCGPARSAASTGSSRARDVQYRIGSITKTLVAVLVMQLRDEGALDLNDRLDAHLPGDRLRRPDAARPARARDRHALRAGGVVVGAQPGRSSFDELAAGLSEGDAPFAPGTTFHYTNVAYGAARRGRRPAPRRPVVRRGSRADPASRSACTARRTSRRRRTPPASACTTTPAR